MCYISPILPSTPSIRVKIILTILLSCCLLPAIAQLHLKGTLIQPGPRNIPFANIGISQKDQGTISNAEGEFSLQLPSSCLHDTITLSCPGYFIQQVPVSDMIINRTGIYILYPKEEETVSVSISMNPDLDTSGIKDPAGSSRIPATSNSSSDIFEVAQLIKMNGKEGQVNSAHLFLQLQQPDILTFRINFYQIENGMPGKRLIDKNIILTQSISNGWFDIDLSNYNILLSQDCYISYEYLPTAAGSTRPFAIDTRKNGTLSVRKSSHGRWQQKKGTPTAYVEISY
ncbi:carboxypeptidase-like regulatory domain-containing protein [Chitinophaga pendula]|uniref:hypothetical protein n=1 Tax=Chitinophaga TaxID=79328 RepID=UPI000BAFFFAC|nr:MULTISPECIES: hypothetical protein [Chitinophaga]ASZ10449.1 hypothetical protein CK934_05400 [Chitinophaga sp. MD30]UCJ06579.1 carboxypeptidase-like regulatory domain-containing protein [Chitinophaga pendula]